MWKYSSRTKGIEQIMKAAHIGLIMAVAAFLAWIGWLGYLAATVTRPTVLSRPQLLVSKVDVFADVAAGAKGKPETMVTVRQVLGSAGSTDLRPDQKITVDNLPDDKKSGWQGPGLYLLPLAPEDSHFRVVPIPPSPGYAGGEARIYLITDSNREQVLHQLESIRKPEQRPPG